MFSFSSFAMANTFLIGSKHLLKIALHKFSNFALVIFINKSFPLAIDSISISVSLLVVNSFLAISHFFLSLNF